MVPKTAEQGIIAPRCILIAGKAQLALGIFTVSKVASLRVYLNAVRQGKAGSCANAPSGSSTETLFDCTATAADAPDFSGAPDVESWTEGKVSCQIVTSPNAKGCRDRAAPLRPRPTAALNASVWFRADAVRSESIRRYGSAPRAPRPGALIFPAPRAHASHEFVDR